MELPSRFSLNSKVEIDFGASGKVINCTVIKIHFSEDKVLYDVAVRVDVGSKIYQTRVYNIDSVFVIPPTIIDEASIS